MPKENFAAVQGRHLMQYWSAQRGHGPLLAPSGSDKREFLSQRVAAAGG